MIVTVQVQERRHNMQKLSTSQMFYMAGEGIIIDFIQREKRKKDTKQYSSFVFTNNKFENTKVDCTCFLINLPLQLLIGKTHLIQVIRSKYSQVSEKSTGLIQSNQLNYNTYFFPLGRSQNENRVVLLEVRVLTTAPPCSPQSQHTHLNATAVSLKAVASKLVQNIYETSCITESSSLL